ncbi:MAG: hypothetical protein IPI48_15385 [bacterium]|nr:hypothetical protein [bacterium]
MKWDDARGNGVVTTTTQSRYGLQLRHQFRAERFLAKMGLYKPGASQNVNMDVDISYQSDRTDRENPGLAATAPTGTKRISVEPRFTYQISAEPDGRDALQVQPQRQHRHRPDPDDARPGRGGHLCLLGTG